MLSKGRYKIENVINISTSLQSQKRNAIDDGDERNDFGGQKRLIFKAVLSMNDTMVVSYFIDHTTPGKSSVIEISENPKYPILRKSDYVVLDHKKYIVDSILVEKLLERKK